MTIAPRHEFTREDLDRMPEDGNRYELLSGEIVVSPVPSPRHQVIVTHLLRLLDDAAPEGLLALPAPLDTVLATDSIVQPDVLVCRASDLTPRDLSTPPLLAVEVLSPATARRDLVRKRDLYERSGVGTYWVVDPGQPTLTVWERGPAGFGEPVLVGPDDAWSGDLPFPVTLTPRDLVRGL